MLAFKNLKTKKSPKTKPVTKEKKLEVKNKK